MAAESRTTTFHINTLANAATRSFFVTVPDATRVLSMFAVSESAIAAHATTVLKFEVIDGATTIGRITNDSDETSVAATPGVVGINSAAYVAETTRDLSFESATATGALPVAASGVLELIVSNDTGGAVTDTIYGIEWLVSK